MPSQPENLLEDLRPCALCGKSYGKDEMHRVEMDEPGAYGWVCAECYEEGQGARTMDTMTLVKQSAKYDFYQLEDAEGTWWNIVPTGSPAPRGGYKSQAYIEKIKHEQFTKES